MRVKCAYKFRFLVVTYEKVDRHTMVHLNLLLPKGIEANGSAFAGRTTCPKKELGMKTRGEAAIRVDTIF